MINAQMQETLRLILDKQDRQLRDNRTIIAGLTGISSILETLTEMLAVIGKQQQDTAVWLKEPPKTDIADILKRIASMLEGLIEAVRLTPQSTARAIVDMEASGRG